MNDSVRRAHLIANSKSGKGAGQTLPELAREVCTEAGVELVHYSTETPEAFEREIKNAVAAALKDGGTVIAAGGDGTIRSVAQEAAGTGVRFAVVACGTFNFFARNHRIPEDLKDAFRLAVTGGTRPVRLGEVNGQVFLINASLGIYAKAIRDRENATSRFGRNRFVVIVSSLISFFSRHPRLSVELEAGDESVKLTTPMIFIGNNALQLRNLKMDVARCMKQDMLAVVLLRPLRWLEILKIVWRGFMKTLEQDANLETFCARGLTIHTRRPLQTVALDGELFKMSSPLRVQALPKVLEMVLPPKEDTP